MVDFSGILPEDAVYQAYRINGIQLRVIVPSIQLPCIDLAAVKHDTLNKAIENRQLHLNVVDRSVCIDCLDVQNGKFVIKEVLQVVRVGNCYVDDRNAQTKDCVQKTNERQLIGNCPKNLFESEIVDGADSYTHLLPGSNSRTTCKFLKLISVSRYRRHLLCLRRFRSVR